MNEQNDAYGPVAAAFYDPVYAVLRDGCGDLEFYRGLAREAGGPLLELGCGSGRVLLPIAREGLPCVGVDSSEAMLGQLRLRNPPDNLRLVCARMQDFDLGEERFRLVFSAFRVFQHLLTVDEQLACLARVRRHLASGGGFAFDVFAPRLDRIAVLEEPESEDARFQEQGAEIIRYVSVRRDPSSQVLDLTFRFERRRPGFAPESWNATTRMRYFFRYELEHLLARAGFSRIEFFGGFDRRPYDYFSGETVILARNP